MEKFDQELKEDNDNTRAVTDMLLRHPDDASNQLQVADHYMQSFVQDPLNFVLPRKYSALGPLIDAFARDLGAYCHYIKGIRDSVERGSLAWERVQATYRRLLGRHIQQTRRERADRAIAKATELYGPTNFHARFHWIADLEHSWAQRRLEFLAKRRERADEDRLSADEQAAVLAEFWSRIDREINKGKVPPWN
jgi:hypothetical protein